MKGCLITFEGIDSSGKSTQAKRLKKYLISLGHKVNLLREPGNTDIGERIRSILLDTAHNEMFPLTEVFLYIAARSQITSQVIIPALEKGQFVIMDRFIDSTIAYQGYGRGINIDDIKKFNNLATKGIKPDITFVIDCEPAVALYSSSPQLELDLPINHDRLESEGIDFMRKIREGYIKLCKENKKRMKLINGNRKIKIIELDIQNHVKQFLSGQKL